ncbi:MAG: hypothetical protein ACXWHZ_15715 [Usitatibacter sp.]
MDTSKLSKKVQAHIEALQAERDAARAMRWPDYSMPQPMDAKALGLKFSEIATGWHSHTVARADVTVNLGCFSTIYHNPWGTDRTTSQGSGRFFATKADALRAARIEITELVAKRLALIDAQIAAAELIGE